MEYIRTLTRAFDVGEQAELSLENRSGTVTVRGEDTQEVRVEVVARLWAESEEEANEQAEMVERGIRQEGQRITIRAPSLLARPGLLSLFGRGPRIDYQVTAPRATEARITNRTGRVEVEGISGPLEIESRTGRAEVRQIEGDTTITSRTGAVRVETIGGALMVSSRTGTVMVRRCKGDVSIQARSGAIQVEDIEGRLRAETRTGAIRYSGAVRADIDIEVGTGAVRLAVDPDSIFFLDAETVTGSVRSDLSLRRPSDGAGQKDGPTVRIRTRTGSIRIGTR